MSWNKPVPCSLIGPSWPDVKVMVTETGVDHTAPVLKGFGYNLGIHVGDDRSEVECRRAELERLVGATILWLNQVHGCEVYQPDNAHVATEPPATWPVIPTADASVTCFSNQALAIMTADCLPVVFAAFNREGRALGVAAAHAGWRGLADGVLQNTALALAEATGCTPEQIKAWMGPAIGPDSFEVGPEVREAFLQKNPAHAESFRSGAVGGKYLADIYSLARTALNGAGLRQVQGGGLDTFRDSRWFSHRRGLQDQVPSGRFATLIRLLPGPGA